MGAMEVPRLHQSLDPSASLVWQPRVSYRTGGTAVMLLEALSFVHLSGRVLVDFSQTGSIRPSVTPLAVGRSILCAQDSGSDPGFLDSVPAVGFVKGE